MEERTRKILFGAAALIGAFAAYKLLRKTTSKAKSVN